MPMSCARGIKYLREYVQGGGADLKNVFERVGYFVPVVNEVLVSFAHDEI
jgi:hypothetical protein